MAVEVNLTPQRDEGTGKAKQIEEPVTVSDTSHTEGPTKVGKQQDAEVTYEDKIHEGKPTGAAKQQDAEVTTRDPMTVALEEAENKKKARTAASNKARESTSAKKK